MQSPSRSPKQKRHRASPVFEPSDSESNSFPDSDLDISLTSDANDSLSQTNFSDTKEDSCLWSDTDIDATIIRDSDAIDSTYTMDCETQPPPETSIESRDVKARDILIHNLLVTIARTTRGKGAKTTEQQTRLDVLAMAMMSEEIRTQRLQSAVTRVVGLSRVQQDRGLALLRMQAAEPATPILTLPKMGHSSGPKAAVDLDFVYDWFHNDCPLVDPDKSRRDCYRNRRINCAGKERYITCQRRILNATKKVAADTFLRSDVYRSWQKRMFRTLSPKTVEGCICFCIKEATHKECACTICVEFMYLLKAWHEGRRIWHREEKCNCSGCLGPKAAAYKAASASISAFKAAVCCPRRALPHLRLPQHEEEPWFYPLACCLVKAKDHCDLCQECGWDAKFYRCYSCVERSDKPATWYCWQKTVLPSSGNIRPVLRPYTGTREELLNTIIKTYRPFLQHCWINEMTRHQEKLDVQTFSGATTIVVKTDFAAAAELKAKYTATCEWPTTANQCVALVLHSPGPTRKGQERLVKCDYWRAWSSAKPHHAFHQAVLDKIGAKYKAAIPTLKYMKVKSDGSTTQYKGRLNFFAIGRSHLRPEGLLQLHDFPAAHHYSGPHDNAGKVPRIQMARDETFEKVRIYDYSKCYEYCVKNMAEPARQGMEKGTWGCDGGHYWLAFSDGKDIYKDKYPHIPKRTAFDVTDIKGSSFNYAYHCTGTTAATDTRSSIVKHKFIQCYCERCRSRDYDHCPSRPEFGDWTVSTLRKKSAGTRRVTRTQTAQASQAQQPVGGTGIAGAGRGTGRRAARATRAPQLAVRAVPQRAARASSRSQAMQQATKARRLAESKVPGVESWEEEAAGLGDGVLGDSAWNDVCDECGLHGDLDCCFGCNLAMHPQCAVDAGVDNHVNSEWLCAVCHDEHTMYMETMDNVGDAAAGAGSKSDGDY